MRTIFSLFWLTVVVASCSGIVRGAADVRKIAPINPVERTLVLLTPTAYVGDITAELAPFGFRVLPLARLNQSDAAVTGGGAGLAVYEEARYGLQIDQRLDQPCAFTSSSIYAFTVTVVDVRANTVVLVVRQTGADGPCTTVRSVWPSIAAAIAANWTESAPGQ